MSDATEDQLPAIIGKATRRESQYDTLKLIGLNGVGITSTGTVVSHDRFGDMCSDRSMYANIVLDPEEVRMTQRYMERGRGGHAAEMIMVCPGIELDDYGAPLCPRSAVCPMAIAQRKAQREGNQDLKVPVGARCPVEASMFTDHYQMMSLSLGVTEDIESYADQQMIAELSGIEVRLSRIMASISSTHRDEVETEETVTTNSSGDMMDMTTTRKVGPRTEIMKRLTDRKDKLLSMLLASRKDKRDTAFKFGAVAGGGLSELMDKVGALMKD